MSFRNEYDLKVVDGRVYLQDDDNTKLRAVTVQFSESVSKRDVLQALADSTLPSDHIVILEYHQPVWNDDGSEIKK